MKYEVCGIATVPVHMYVEAYSPEEAIEIAERTPYYEETLIYSDADGIEWCSASKVTDRKPYKRGTQERPLCEEGL